MCIVAQHETFGDSIKSFMIVDSGSLPFFFDTPVKIAVLSFLLLKMNFCVNNWVLPIFKSFFCENCSLAFETKLLM